MKITDKTNQKIDTRTFNVGDVVKATLNDVTHLLYIAQVDKDSTQPVLLGGKIGTFENRKHDSSIMYTFHSTSWQYTKVNAELIITD